MARLYMDEQFPREASDRLRQLGHDVLTVQEAGKAGLRIPDSQVLAFATSLDRAVVTHNRFDFIRLHNQEPNHAGIIACTEDRNLEGLVDRIHTAIKAESTLRGKLIRVVRPAR